MPPELVGREVSVRPLLPLWDAASRRGLSSTELLEGCGYSRAHMTNPHERISWEGFSRFLANLGRFVDDDELVELGAAAMGSRFLRAVLLPGRLLYSVPDVYLWVFGPTGPASQLFVTHEGVIERLGPRHLRYETRMKPGYEPSRENYMLLQGSLGGLARTLGSNAAHVTQESTTAGVAYDVRVRSTSSAFGWLANAAATPFQARTAARELGLAHEELHERYLELRRETDERLRLTREAERDRAGRDYAERLALRELAGHQAAERANNAKSEFLTGMSHELRTPLNAILGFAQLLQSSDLTGEDRDAVEHILAAGNHLLCLTNEVLDIARIEAGSIDLRPERIDIASAVTATLSLVAPLAAQRSLTVRGPTGKPGLFVYADSQRLRQVLLNLLSNAVKYNTHGGAIDVSVEPLDRETIRVTINDTGPGISEDDLDRIFEPFERLGAADTDVEGTGVGLTICRGLVEAMSGRLGTESTFGAGSTFWFELPRVALAAVDPLAG